MSSTEVAAGMWPSQPPPILQQLANPLRWHLVNELARSDRRVTELVDRLQQPGNLVSYHLRNLKRAGIVADRRSSADARDVYYALDFEQVRAAFLAAAASVHPGLAAPSNGAATRPTRLRGTPSVLFLCTHNSARSQMAEIILRSLSGGRVEVRSAGTQPERVHPLALQALHEAGYDVSGLRSKDVAESVRQRFDYVITLCDRIREECPTFAAEPEHIHWSLADPVCVTGSADEVYAAFQHIRNSLTTRISYLLVLIERDWARLEETSGG